MPTETEATRETTSAVLERFNGDAVKMADHLAKVLNDNFKAREDLRDRDARIKELEGKQVPDGAVVLTGDDVPRWQAYTALGKSPDELKHALTEGEAAITERDTLRKDGLIRDVAATVGYDFDVLKDKGGALDYELREVEANGTKTRQALVKDGANVVPLTDYATQHWPKYLPALKQATGTTQTGVQYVEQQRDTGAPVDPITAATQRLQAQRDARGPNPLKPTA